MNETAITVLFAAYILFSIYVQWLNYKDKKRNKIHNKENITEYVFTQKFINEVSDINKQNNKQNKMVGFHQIKEIEHSYNGFKPIRIFQENKNLKTNECHSYAYMIESIGGGTYLYTGYKTQKEAEEEAVKSQDSLA